MSFYLIIFIITLALSAAFTTITRYVAAKLSIVDKPNEERKFHLKTTPLLGGAAIFLAFFLVLFLVRDKLLVGDLQPSHWLSFFIGACLLMLGGYLDDKYDLKPKSQIIFPLLAVLSVIIGGVGIEKITNPFGGLLFLNQLKLPVIYYAGSWHNFLLLADGFTIIWLLGMMYTTKLLDGLDGLVTGITAIGAMIIFLFTMTTKYYQPDIGLAALALAAACLGFLIFNWHPAKIFLGEGGSLLLGFTLGVLAIISGGKIAIALLILGIPIMDVAWTIARRLAARKNPFKFADHQHLHFRLLELGLGVRKTVLIFYLFSAVFGLSALFLQSKSKLLALMILAGMMLFIVIGFNILDRSKKIV